MSLQLTYTPIINYIEFQNLPIGVLRLDLIDPEISGNKWFKLKYNIIEARQSGKKSILTFGGAFSNHIAATAKACYLEGIQSIALVRGESDALQNPTLSKAKELGMEFVFLSREEYKKKHELDFLSSLQTKYPNSYIIPEGGNNELGELGCAEILNQSTEEFNQIFCAVGTGSTFKGIGKSIKSNQFLTGINVLNYQAQSNIKNTIINNDYHFGGYAKHNSVLIDFKNWLEKKCGIELDYIYTAKLFYAVFDMIEKKHISTQDNCLIIHSGGLQGNAGYKKRYNLKPNL